MFLNELINSEFKGYWLGTISWTIRPTILNVKRFKKEEITKKCSTFVSSLFEQVLIKENKLYWYDSTPFNILYSQKLLQIFPKAKIAHIFRDSRDVLCSYLSKKWGGKIRQTLLIGL